MIMLNHLSPLSRRLRPGENETQSLFRLLSSNSFQTHHLTRLKRTKYQHLQRYKLQMLGSSTHLNTPPNIGTGFCIYYGSFTAANINQPAQLKQLGNHWKDMKAHRLKQKAKEPCSESTKTMSAPKRPREL